MGPYSEKDLLIRVSESGTLPGVPGRLPVISLFFMLTLILLPIFPTSPALADISESQTASSAHSSEFVSYPDRSRLSWEDMDLEDQAWTCPDFELFNVEKLIVSKIQQKPYSAFYHYLLSHLYVRIYAINPSRVDLLKKSGDLADQAIQLSKDQLWGYLAVADLLDMMGKVRAAQSLLKQAEMINDFRSDWRLTFAQARLNVGQVGALETLNQLQKSLSYKDASKKIIMPFLVTVVADQFNEQDAQQLFLSLNEKHPHEILDIIIGINYSTNGQYQKARQIYSNVLKANPDSMEARINRAVLLYRYLDMPDLSRKEFLSVLERSGLNNEIRSVVFAHLGSIAMLKSDGPRALHYYSQSLEQSVQKSLTLEFILNSYAKEKNPENLISFLEDAVVKIPGVSELYAILGGVYSERVGNYKKAVESMENAILLDPDQQAYYGSLGLYHYELKDYQLASVSFKRAITLDPNDALAYYNLACVQALMNQNSDAIESLDKAIILNPRMQALALHDKDFNSIRHSTAFKFVTRERGWTRIDNKSRPQLKDPHSFLIP